MATFCLFQAQENLSAPKRSMWLVSATLIFQVPVPDTTVNTAAGDAEQSTALIVPCKNMMGTFFVGSVCVSTGAGPWYSLTGELPDSTVACGRGRSAMESCCCCSMACTLSRKRSAWAKDC